MLTSDDVESAGPADNIDEMSPPHPRMPTSGPTNAHEPGPELREISVGVAAGRAGTQGDESRAKMTGDDDEAVSLAAEPRLARASG